MERPFRLRSRAYLSFIRGRPCLHCGMPGEPHHITFAQPKARGLKSGDQYTVPLCRTCHTDLHTGGLPERVWFATKGIIPVVWAEDTYAKWLKEQDDGDRLELSG